MSDSAGILEALRSQHLETRLTAIDRAAAADSPRYAAAVVCVISLFPDDAYFVFERIVKFGEAAVVPLQRLMASSASQDAIEICCLSLARLGQSVDVDVLLGAIRRRSSQQHLACRALASSGVRTAIPHLLAMLKQTGSADEHRVSSIVWAIQDLGGDIPPDEVGRFRAAYGEGWRFQNLFAR